MRFIFIYLVMVMVGVANSIAIAQEFDWKAQPKLVQDAAKTLKANATQHPRVIAGKLSNARGIALWSSNEASEDFVFRKSPPTEIPDEIAAEDFVFREIQATKQPDRSIAAEDFIFRKLEDERIHATRAGGTDGLVDIHFVKEGRSVRWKKSEPHARFRILVLQADEPSEQSSFPRVHAVWDSEGDSPDIKTPSGDYSVLIYPTQVEQGDKPHLSYEMEWDETAADRSATPSDN
ncbi:hypothetical protein DTL42_10345 [Bremerella cremea]|uniref:Uncharacterized protein n=1 Tax=Bremerella cremea TaxID=1031537 RepID=A0A368KVA8_9BACT|nr:hypothetical protein [Bremerella cremea]RCS50508.1 hypothetical protein DTL42_10345 [Bremerella cremea]